MASKKKSNIFKNNENSEDLDHLNLYKNIKKDSLLDSSNENSDTSNYYENHTNKFLIKNNFNKENIIKIKIKDDKSKSDNSIKQTRNSEINTN